MPVCLIEFLQRKAQPRRHRLERAPIDRPDRMPVRLNRLERLQLRKQHRRVEVAHQVARADAAPGVLVHLATQELAPIRALLPHHLGAVKQRCIVDDERPALATGEVLRRVKAERRERPIRCHRPARMGRTKALRRIHQQRHAVTRTEFLLFRQPVRYAVVPHGYHGAGPRVEQRRHIVRTHRPAVAIDLCEPNRHAAKREGIRGARKGEARHDDFVARLKPEHERHHLKRMGARSRQQRTLHAEQLPEQRARASGEGTVARCRAGQQTGCDVVRLSRDGAVACEGNHGAPRRSNRPVRDEPRSRGFAENPS